MSTDGIGYPLLSLWNEPLEAVPWYGKIVQAGEVRTGMCVCWRGRVWPVSVTGSYKGVTEITLETGGFEFAGKLHAVELVYFSTSSVVVFAGPSDGDRG